MNTENYEFHEAANLFPMMDSESFESLKKDISANGLIEPICHTQKGHTLWQSTAPILAIL